MIGFMFHGFRWWKFDHYSTLNKFPRPGHEYLPLREDSIKTWKYLVVSTHLQQISPSLPIGM